MKHKHRATRRSPGKRHPPRPAKPATNGAAKPQRGPHVSAAAPRPRGSTWLYGIHPVLAAVANPQRRCLRIVLTPETEFTVGARIEVLSQAHPMGMPPPDVMPREKLDALLPRGAVNQGVAALVEAVAETSVEDICRATESEATARIVVLDQVTDPHNVGAVIRSAAAFGAAAVVLPERHSPPATGTLAKAASGALERVPLVRTVNLARALEQLKQAGFWCVGLDAMASQSLGEADLSGKIALVLGAEGEGLRRLTRDKCDLMVRIPIEEGVESLNVSNAAAVGLYELARRG